MDVKFNAHEVFEIAERIERNGAKFYRQAAGFFDDPITEKLFLELASWEIGHERVFAEMRKQLSAQSRELRTFEPDNNLRFEAQVMAGLAVFGLKAEPEQEFTGKESKKEIFKKALKKEEDSIVFYVGLKEFVPDRAGKDRIEDIVREEMRHIGILNQSLDWR